MIRIRRAKAIVRMKRAMSIKSVHFLGKKCSKATMSPWTFGQQTRTVHRKLTAEY